ncbi:LTA synthase family protein [Sunxiuqinia dokdonensis]|uniref:Sulfatase N-terminal domain-containing protein n=1 Tax=Sunxiuqinia dokdonensis TaxID=1409788 RepID=A0A0L8VDT7_9BACT|nr:LTA synthase family protein [Sunxiuqinia dokdonensis]KOH46337.1 hypothetical protein NC99_08740 [Sunxiuqinia dokdonensis]
MKSEGRNNKLFKNATHWFGGYAVVLLSLLLLLRIFEIFSGQVSQLLPAEGAWRYYASAFYTDLIFWLFIMPILFVIFLACFSLSVRMARFVAVTLFSLVVLVHGMLGHYFSTALNPLGADLFHYSLQDIRQTAGAAISGPVAIGLIIGIVLIVLVFVFLPRHLKLPVKLTYSLLAVSIASFFFAGIAPAKPSAGFGSEFIDNSVINKSAFFYGDTFYHLADWEREESLPLFADAFLGYDGQSRQQWPNKFAYPDPNQFPFLHEKNSVDVFSSFLKKNDTPPDLVMIIVEGLGRAFSNEDAYMGSFTPFLDSLSNHSMYWENCLSTSGRTFAVLPSLLASLPFGEHGFAEMGETMPPHQSLINLLQRNGYHSRFMYAGDSEFDKMNLFMQQQGCDEIIDKTNFGDGYELLPANASGFSWGYGDFELYRRFFNTLELADDHRPSVNVLLTVATHSPFQVNNQEQYQEQFQQILPSLGLDERMEALCRAYQQQLETVLYMDDALRSFFEGYRKRESFENTIFIITGDHRMPDIPMATKIDRYHVPLIVYSPLIERPTKFSSVVSHFDVTPSLTAFFESEFDFDLPELACWMGVGLDSTLAFSNKSTFPLMQTKTAISDLVSGEYFLNEEKIYRMGPHMTLIEEDDAELADRLRMDLQSFKNKNTRFVQERRLYPDSLLPGYTPPTVQLD